jgi:hypothetical protein
LDGRNLDDFGRLKELSLGVTNISNSADDPEREQPAKNAREPRSSTRSTTDGSRGLIIERPVAFDS